LWGKLPSGVGQLTDKRNRNAVSEFLFPSLMRRSGVPQFTFFKMRGDAAINSFDIEEFDTAQQAEAYARRILKKSSYEAIEVTNGQVSSQVRRDKPLSAEPTVR